MDDFEGACKAYRVAARLKDDAATWFSLGLCADGNERIEAYRVAVKHDPADGLSWHFLANALADSGNRQEAIRCFTKAIEHSDKASSAWALCDLGLCYLANHDWDQSMDAFERSVRADEGYAFDIMAANIADACLDHSSDFAYALHHRLQANLPQDDFFLKCFVTRLGQKQSEQAGTR